MELNRSTILVVEDEPILLEMISHWLGLAGARVLTAESAPLGLEAIASTPVDLIVTDMRLLHMDGLSLLKTLKSQGTPAPTIVFSNADSNVSTHVSTRDAYDLGVEATLSKPVTRQQLVVAAERILVQKASLWGSRRQDEGGHLLSATFGSLDSALESGQIAFGRGGFCMESSTPCSEGPVQLAIKFAADVRSLSGYGFIRWSAPRERRVGIEIAQLEDADLDWVVHLTTQNSTSSFIPRDTVVKQQYGSGSGDASHELRNLLAVIIAYSDACQELLKPDDPVNNYVDQMRLCTQRAASLICQVRSNRSPSVLPLSERRQP
jgi:CheY-like chemotaxis protein